jgi:hypothetical protein
MITIDLARRLRDAGLHWHPEDGDRFFIPDRDLDDEIFSLSKMTVGVRTVTGGLEISFNGAVEWALDSIMKHEVVWLPTETQLRTLLDERFRSLEAIEGGFRCVADIDGTRLTFAADTASDAYGLALLAGLGGDVEGTVGDG